LPLQPFSSVPVLDAVLDAIDSRDGPQFLSSLSLVNALVNLIARDGALLVPAPSDIVSHVMEEAYQRSVAPYVHILKKYQPFSSNVYGELTPTFVHMLVERTGLRQGSLFMDLGSGVGNVVLQVACQTGCQAYGVEIMDSVSSIANNLKASFLSRCKMWGLPSGAVELEHGDMRYSGRTDALLIKPDVVLLNNKSFDPKRESLSPFPRCFLQ